MNCEKWEAYPKEIVSAHDVWGLTQQGDMKSAQDIFNALVTKKSKNAWPYIKLAKLLYNEGYIDKAKDILQLGISTADNKDHPHHCNFAEYYEKTLIIYRACQ